MSKFGDLPVDAQIDALGHLAKAGFAAAFGSYAVLIARGLISPDEFSGVIQPVIDEIEKVDIVGEDGMDWVIEKLADLKRLSAATWKGE